MKTLVRLTIATLLALPAIASAQPAPADPSQPNPNPPPDGAPAATPDGQPPATSGSSPSPNSPDNAAPAVPSSGTAPMTAPSPPAAAPSSVPKNAEFTTLRILHDKGLISDAELQTALSEIGLNGAGDATTLVVSKIKATIYGFAQADYSYQSTETCSDLCGGTQVPKSGTYKGNHGRTIFSPQDSRFGIRLASPEEHGIRATGLWEGDFFGPTTTTEQGTFVNPEFRTRHAYVKFETPIVDVLLGQTWSLYGWQPNFLAPSILLPGLPGQLFERTTQARITKVIKSDAVNVEIAGAANRPPQEDSATPEGVLAARIMINKFQGLHSAYMTQTSVIPASIGVSGDLRGFRFNNFAAVSTHGITKTGGGFAADAYIPLIPATKENKDNALSITAEFSVGYGTEDAYTALGAAGTANAALAPAMPGGTPPTYTPNFDPGLAVVDAAGNFELVRWTTWTVAAEYCAPGTNGRLGFLFNYQHSESPNAKNIGAAAEVNGVSEAAATAAAAKVRDHEDLFEFGIFGDPTRSTRLAISGSVFDDSYADGKDAKNYVVLSSAFIFF